MTPPELRTGMRRAIVIVPSAFTSGSLFFGLWSIVMSARGDFEKAGWFIVVAGVMDLLDGRIARMTSTGSAFGAELDSLVDVISFGVAPALLMYHVQFSRGEWAWLLPLAYVWATAIRLARFNVEQAGHAKTQFYGLPCPAAGGTIATFVPFSMTPLFQEHLGHLPWPLLLAMLLVFLALLMVSHIPYPVMPRMGVRTWGERAGLAFLLLTIYAAFNFAAYYFFPLAVTFIAFGLVRAMLFGVLDRRADRELGPESDEVAEPSRRGFAFRGRRRGAGRREAP